MTRRSVMQRRVAVARGRRRAGGAARAGRSAAAVRRQVAGLVAGGSGRRRGKAVSMEVRERVALRLLHSTTPYRTLARDHGVAVGTVAGIARRLARRFLGAGARLVRPLSAAAARGAVRCDVTRDALRDALRDRPRGGGARVRARRRRLGRGVAHERFVRNAHRVNSKTTHDELRALIAAEFGVRVAVGTVGRYVRRLGVSRKRTQRALPRNALRAPNVAWRRRFVREWFGASADAALVGTRDEFADQRHWRLRAAACPGAARCRAAACRHVTDVRQVFFIDETGVNRHALRRRYGYAPRGSPALDCGGDGAPGPNHSTIIAVGADCGVLARRVLVARQRGTRRDDFCRFLRGVVGRAMLRAARASGLPPDAPLYLMMDNASIHKGEQVSRALRSASRRLHVAYQPPYMPTVNPVELVNAQLKQRLQKAQSARVVAAMLPLLRAAGRRGTVPTLPQPDVGDLTDEIERILDTEVSAAAVRGFYRHCGWR